ncbi:MAG: diacylglycerol kinase family protein [Dongiaceae bacterium]
MNKIGLISNAKSTRNIASMQGVHDVLSVHPDVTHMIFHDIRELRVAMDAMAAQDVTHLVISGGDGTVQASVNHLVKDQPFRKAPILSLISGGMTNVVALDVGVPGRPAPALKRLIERVKAGDVGTAAERSLIALSLDGGKTQTYGFLAGAVGFYQGTLLSRRKVHRMGLRQSLAANATILLSLLSLLYYGPGDRSGFRGERIKIAYDQDSPHERDIFLLLMTTLHRLIPGVMPFWGDAEKRIRFTQVDHPPRRLLCAVWPALRGRASPWMEEAGYHSGSLNRLFMNLQSPLVMDGELFKPDPEHGILISAGPAIQFHRF